MEEYSDADEGSVGYIVLILVVILVIGLAGAVVWYFMRKPVAPVPFRVTIINATGLLVNAILPTGIATTFTPNQTYPETIFLSGSTFSYSFTVPGTSTIKNYTGTINGTETNAQTWYLTRGGIARRKASFTVTNGTSTLDSCCNLNGAVITFTPVIIWDPYDVTLNETLSPIESRKTVSIDYYYLADKNISIEFRYTPPYTGAEQTAWIYNPLKMNPVSDGTNLVLLLNSECKPLYPTDTRCDGTKPVTIDPNSGPTITFKLGTKPSGGSGTLPFIVPGTTASTDFVIATDEPNTNTPAGRVLLRSKNTPSSNWFVYINQIQNSNLYVGADLGTKILYGKDSTNKYTELYKVCKKDSHTLYIWGGKVSSTFVDSCGNTATANTDCKYTVIDSGSNLGYYTCVAHLSEDSGNYLDPCNSDVTNNCTTDAECRTVANGGKCWTRRYCDTTIGKCDIPRAESQSCTKDSMCSNGLKCNNGYCGTAPVGGSCATNLDCKGGLWCYKQKCTEKSNVFGPCDPSKSSTVSCGHDLCCKSIPYLEWEPATVIESCGTNSAGQQCQVYNSPRYGGEICGYCMTSAGAAADEGCPANTTLMGCSPLKMTRSCPPGYTFVEDSSRTGGQGACIKCPKGYTTNPKYLLNGVLKCDRISTQSYSNTGCIDMCIPAPGESGAVCKAITPSEPCTTF